MVKRRCDGPISGPARFQLASARSRRKAVLRRVVRSCLATIQTVLFGTRRPGDLATLTVTVKYVVTTVLVTSQVPFITRRSARLSLARNVGGVARGHPIIALRALQEQNRYSHDR